MARLGLETAVVDRDVYHRSVARFRDAGVLLPTFAQLAAPMDSRPADLAAADLDAVDPDTPDARNLWRVHWHNGDDRRSFAAVPAHLELPPSLTGVPARIVVLLGDRFPMIRAHKVLAAYGCLVPRIVTGQFDPTSQKALWPSTGNYCRGGVAISRILGCRGVAILPEGMSAERFAWLDRWVVDPGDVVRTPGTESNVKEIYDACNELERDPGHVVFNQFSEFGNHLVHWLCTGRALARVFEQLRATRPELRLRAFASATGSAGTLAAGDHLKDEYGARIAAVEALECPTLLENGFGEHNIQGIGDKHVPLIHNVMNTDAVVGVSDRSTDQLDVLFNSEVGRRYLVERQGIDSGLVAALPSLGLSSLCNVVACIKLARHYGFGPDDVLMTVATDGAELYASEHQRTLARDFGGAFDQVHAGEVFAEHLRGAGTDHVLELREQDRRRIFNLGYFTWVEQQGVSLEDFTARREQAWWRKLRDLVPAWDAAIAKFDAQTGLAP